VNLEERFVAAIQSLPPKPPPSADARVKGVYSQAMSNALAAALGAHLRSLNCKEARPANPGELDSSGAERRMAGGIGAKKVDVTWATEEAGLIFAASIKTINFKDARSGNYQKNLTNRRGDMLFEAVTLHRRFPYSVLLGLFFLDVGAASDGKMKGNRETRKSTFLNAHQRLRLFTGRDDPAGRDEQLETLCVLLVDVTSSPPIISAYQVGNPNDVVPLDEIIERVLVQVAERNPDFYEFDPATRSMIRLRS
jgi:hypothetical protein